MSRGEGAPAARTDVSLVRLITSQIAPTISRSQKIDSPIIHPPCEVLHMFFSFLGELGHPEVPPTSRSTTAWCSRCACRSCLPCRPHGLGACHSCHPCHRRAWCSCPYRPRASTHASARRVPSRCRPCGLRVAGLRGQLP